MLPVIGKGQVQVRVAVEIGQHDLRRTGPPQRGPSSEGSVVVDVQVDDVVGQVVPLAHHDQINIAVAVQFPRRDIVGLRSGWIGSGRSHGPAAQVELHVHGVVEEVVAGPCHVGIAVPVEVRRSHCPEETPGLVARPRVEQVRDASLWDKVRRTGPGEARSGSETAKRNQPDDEREDEEPCPADFCPPLPAACLVYGRGHSRVFFPHGRGMKPD
jgi:hypothetical protein